MKRLSLLVISMLMLSYGCGNDTNASALPETTVLSIIYHTYSSVTYGETYRDVTTEAACHDNMQAVSAGCDCLSRDEYGTGYKSVSAQYLSSNAAHCDCAPPVGVMFYPATRTEAAYVTCAETVLNSNPAL